MARRRSSRVGSSWCSGSEATTNSSFLSCGAQLRRASQDELVLTEPDRFFRPPYVGGRGWLGVRLDGEIDWHELSAICEEAFRTVAPQKAISTLDRRRG